MGRKYRTIADGGEFIPYFSGDQNKANPSIDRSFPYPMEQVSIALYWFEQS